MGNDEFAYYPHDAGANSMYSLNCLLQHIKDQAIEDENEPLIGLSDAALALMETIQREIEKDLDPIRWLRLLRKDKSPENERMGIAGDFIRFETLPGAPFEIIPASEATNEQ